MPQHGRRWLRDHGQRLARLEVLEALESDRREVEEDHIDGALAKFWLGRLVAWWVCVWVLGLGASSVLASQAHKALAFAKEERRSRQLWRRAELPRLQGVASGTGWLGHCGWPRRRTGSLWPSLSSFVASRPTPRRPPGTGSPPPDLLRGLRIVDGQRSGQGASWPGCCPLATMLPADE